MIRTQGCTLSDFEHCARNLCPDEREVFYEITGQPWRADSVAAQLWLGTGLYRWTFYETVERLPVAVGGYELARPGVYASWFMATPLAWSKLCGGQLTEAVRGVVARTLEQPEVRRLETVTLATRTRAREWYERIGLTYESTARRASASGKDLVTYVALRGS